MQFSSEAHTVVEVLDRIEWVLLAYRLPREPSTPRISVWRKLRRLGVAQVVDGFVALPADARSRERLEWVAAEVLDAGGDAHVWLGRLTSARQERALAAAGAAAAMEPGPRTRTMRRLLRELRRLVDPAERTAAAAYTNTARYFTRPLGPPLAGALQSIGAVVPFVAAGAIKSVHDVVLWRRFARVPLPEEAMEVRA